MDQDPQEYIRTQTAELEENGRDFLHLVAERRGAPPDLLRLYYGDAETNPAKVALRVGLVDELGDDALGTRRAYLKGQEARERRAAWLALQAEPKPAGPAESTAAAPEAASTPEGDTP